MRTSGSVSAVLAILAAATTLGGEARAATASIDFNGPGVSGSLVLTYGAATDAKYPNAFEVTSISGSFSDSNNGLNIVDATVGPLVAITHSTPESSNLLAPNDFSRYAVTTGLGPDNHGFLTYDNLYWPGGSSQTASDYPVSGGVLDIYGLMFDIGGGRVVDFWSNGVGAGGVADYGVAVATHDLALDYVGGGVAAVPEPGAYLLMGGGLLALMAWRRRSAAG